MSVPRQNTAQYSGRLLTLLPDEAVIPVVRVVRVSQTAMRVLEFEELVSVLARMASAGGDASGKTGIQGDRVGTY